MNKYKNLPLLLLILCGCSSIDTNKYIRFKDSIENLNTGMENSVGFAHQSSRKRGIKKLATDPNARISELFITVSGYEWEMDKTPTYLKLKKLLKQLKFMNENFYNYSLLLSELADSKIGKDDLDKTVSELNNESLRLTKSLNIKNSEQGVGILSALSIGLLQEYIDSKKEKLLLASMKKNQETVKNYVSLSINLIHLIKSQTVVIYSERSMEIFKVFQNSKSKEQQASELFDLNDSLIENLEIYGQMEAAYLVIPEAHLALAKVDSGNGYKSKLDRLVKAGNKLSVLHKYLINKEGEQ